MQTPDRSDTVALVVDDDPVVLAAAAAMITPRVDRLIVASTAEEGIRRIDEAEHLDIVVSDFDLGGALNGHDVLRRAAKRFSSCATVLVSGWPASEAKLVDHGFVQKPFGRRALLDAVGLGQGLEPPGPGRG